MALGLDNYQLEAINNMKNGCVLCGGVGSGKSRTALGYYYKVNGIDIIGNDHRKIKSNHAMNLYVITTAKKRDSKEWEDDMLPFLLSPDPEIDGFNHKVVIDSWNNIQKYKLVENSFFIFDEQRLVGSGVWVKSFLKIAKTNQWILLSATPGDTWSDYIPIFIANGFYKNKSEFSREHIVYSRFTNYPKIERYLGEQKLRRERNEILVDMDYRPHTKRHYEIVECDYDKSLYKSLIKNRWDPFDDCPIENGSKLYYLQRKVSNTSVDRNLKLLEILDSHPKAIIFYNYDYELLNLKCIFEQTKKPFAEWNGHKHEPIPTANEWVYLVQYVAGNEGWNCIETDTIIFYSQHPSYRVLEQASGRIDRRNTPFDDLYYYRLKSNSPIDVRMNAALANKKNFNSRNLVHTYNTKYFAMASDKKDDNDILSTKQKINKNPFELEPFIVESDPLPDSFFEDESLMQEKYSSSNREDPFAYKYAFK